jgi:hypothetical protein
MKTQYRPYIGGYKHVKEQLSNRYDEYINLVQYYKKYVKKRKGKVINKYEKRIDKKNNRVYVYHRTKRWEYPVTVYGVTHKKQYKFPSI